MNSIEELVKVLEKALEKMTSTHTTLLSADIEYQKTYDKGILASTAPSADRREAEARTLCRDKGYEDTQAAAKDNFFATKSVYEIAKLTLEIYKDIERIK